MPRNAPKSKQKLAGSVLRASLKRLDALRSKITEMTKDAERLSRDALSMIKRNAVGDEIFIGTNRKAMIVTPDEITTDATKFREIALMQGADLAVIDACFTLGRERAAHVIGDTKLNEITTRSPGKVSHITFTGKR